MNAQHDESNYLSDHELVTRFQCGDDSAFEELIKKHGKMLASIISARYGGSNCLDDALQESWLQVWRSLKNDDVDFSSEGTSFLAWITVIAKRKVTDLWRREKPALGQDHLDASSTTQDERYDPVWNAMQVESIEVVRNCLEKVKRDFRSVLSLKMEGLSDAEISERLTIPMGTVASRFNRGKAEMQECIEGKTQS